MAFDRFLIGPINTGLETDLKPFLIPEDAFTNLQNAYVFRGRIRKRFGTSLMGATQASSRLAFSLGNNTNAAMNLPANTTVHTPQLAIGQIFTLGIDIFTVYQLGMNVATLTTNPLVTALIDSTSNPNTITFTGGALTTVYWYPSFPVMGITQYLTGAVNNHPTYAFDTEFAYTFSGGHWNRSGTGTAPQWNGSSLNYFYSTNWQDTSNIKVLFTTNFQVTNLNGAGVATDDPIWWTADGATWNSIKTSANNGFYFRPNSGSAFPNGPFVVTCKIILPFKNRLILLNTVENNNAAGFGGGVNSHYPQRCRYSWNGSPFAANAWYEPNTSDSSGNFAAGAGYVDAPTEEQIIAAEFIRDRLIVYFERSTWELVYTASEVLPFVWQKINTELGAMSTFSSVPFDKQVFAIGQSGIHQCNGANVERIDNKIPDLIFDDFNTGNSLQVRTAGIRDYYTEMVYWAFADVSINETNQLFANQILVYNYKNGSWALNDDCFTTFGYFEQISDATWTSLGNVTWQQFDGNWIDNIQDANKRQILAGTPEGFVLIINQDRPRNAPSMSITNITFTANVINLNVINHNLAENDFVLIENILSTDGVAALNNSIFQVSVIDANNFTFVTPLISGSYNGGGTVARVSQIDIQSKWINPYMPKDRNIYLHKVDFAVDKTDFGQITVDYFPSSSSVSMINEGIATGMIMGNNVLETTAYLPAFAPLEQWQDMLWHPVYFQSTGESIQLRIYLATSQMLNLNIAISDFVMNALILYTQASAQRLQ